VPYGKTLRVVKFEKRAAQRENVDAGNFSCLTVLREGFSLPPPHKNIPRTERQPFPFRSLIFIIKEYIHLVHNQNFQTNFFKSTRLHRLNILISNVWKF